MLVLELYADFKFRLLFDSTLKLRDASLLIFLRAQKLLDLGQVAVDCQVFPRQLLDDLVLALDVLTKAVVFLFNSGLLLEDLDELILNDLLLLLHLFVCGIHFGLHQLVVLATEPQLLFELEDVAGAGFDARNVLLLGLELGSKRLQFRVIALDLALKQILLELGPGQLLLELAVLAD